MATIVEIAQETTPETYWLGGHYLTVQQIHAYYIFDEETQLFIYDEDETFRFSWRDVPSEIQKEVFEAFNINPSLMRRFSWDIVIELDTPLPKPASELTGESLFIRLWVNWVGGFKPIPIYVSGSALTHFFMCLFVSLLNFLYFCFYTPLTLVLLVAMILMSFIIYGICLPTRDLFYFFRDLTYRKYYRRLGHCLIDYAEYYIARFLANPWLCIIFLIGAALAWWFELTYIFHPIVQFIEFSSLMKASWDSHEGNEEQSFPWEADTSELLGEQPYDKLKPIYVTIPDYKSGSEDEETPSLLVSTSSTDEE